MEHQKSELLWRIVRAVSEAERFPYVGGLRKRLRLPRPRW